MMAYVMALTGGIGSGKSTVATMFAERGVPVLDLDQVGHDCLNKPLLRQHLVEIFGVDILDENGHVQRKILATKAFSDAKATQQLNHILHPAIQAQEKHWLAQQQAPYVIIEASVLLESGAQARMDAVVVVVADVDIRRKRVLQRGYQDEAAFERILQRQCDDALRRLKADFIIENSGDRSVLEGQVTCLHQQWMRDYG